MTTIDIKWFPPSWIQIKTSDELIYIDPAYLKKYYAGFSNKVEFSTWPDAIDGLPDKDLEKADVILVTHHHKDHCKKVTLNRLNKKDTVVIAPKACSKELGNDITVIKAGEEIEAAEIKIRAVEAYNTRRGHKVKIAHKKGIGVGYVINLRGRIIYHAGDTDMIQEMANLGPIDVALLPIGGRDFTMDVADAVHAVRMIKPKIVIPIHHFDADPREFKNRVENCSDIKVELLEVGEVYYLS